MTRGSRVCPKCEVVKPPEAFTRTQRACRDCRRAYDLKRRYGATPAQIDHLTALQGAQCAICRTETPGGRGWHVDHDHETGAVRGVTCGNCNTALGKLRDDPEVVASALVYLTSHGRSLDHVTYVQFLGALERAHQLSEGPDG